MSQSKSRNRSRKASAAQTDAMAHAVSHLETDVQATAVLGTGTWDDSTVYANLPEEEIVSASKVDFSVLKCSLKEVNILNDDSVRLLAKEQLYDYISYLAETLNFYVGQYEAVSAQLANVMELILNQRNELFGSTSQRSSSLFGKKAEDTGSSTGRKDRKNSTPNADGEDGTQSQEISSANASDSCNAEQLNKDTDCPPGQRK